MSVSSEVKRTLVKSPPELWAELSDAAALARHFGELGEIRIVGTEPEQAVHWEAPQVSGTVHIEPSGWGTKVTLTATRTAVPPDGEPELPTPAPSHSPSPWDSATPAESTLEPSGGEPQVIEKDVSEITIAEIEVEETAITPATEAGVLLNVAEIDGEDVESEPTAEIAMEAAMEQTFATPIAPVAPIERGPRRGLFARIFRRKPKPQLTPEEYVTPTPEPEQRPALESANEAEPLPPAGEARTETEPIAVEASPESQPQEGEPIVAQASAKFEPLETEPIAVEAPPEPQETDLATELTVLEEQTTAVLVAVLDRLGAAHHRPFSRA